MREPSVLNLSSISTTMDKKISLLSSILIRVIKYFLYSNIIGNRLDMIIIMTESFVLLCQVGYICSSILTLNIKTDTEC